MNKTPSFVIIKKGQTQYLKVRGDTGAWESSQIQQTVNLLPTGYAGANPAAPTLERLNEPDPEGLGRV
ncbi:hypothetical protein COT20_02375 [bacterium (Candidatus Gribaldobacteria) CG08_land_8_20_14_0_20_39_15]|uniref:Uncharacterized protein n=1 Tax=bacterium (Candidatus Gribaldobacteria) CG08_land_8_20_14_0_20_39_15 TaxID=2014273 RepID=A0A2M6XU32_9BACT|nr:MAG: hypothetical protein COT20_02375 [bacterium (Candidatus Gribaldobacteria) CG08_land_8_20_14_0_20_39_15]